MPHQTGNFIVDKTLGPLTKLLRFTDYKRNTPFDVGIRTLDGRPVARVSRGISLFLPKVSVFDEQERRIGGFQQKLFSIGGAFRVMDADDQPICELKGKWTSWDFRFMSGQTELAHVSKNGPESARSCLPTSKTTCSRSLKKSRPIRLFAR